MTQALMYNNQFAGDMMTPDYKALCVELLEAFQELRSEYNGAMPGYHADGEELIQRVKQALAETNEAPPH